MSRETMRDKAVRSIAEERVLVLKANEHGVALEVTGSKPDRANLMRPTYRTLVYRREGAIVRECSCPAPRRCYHIQAAELLWRPGPHDRSDR